MRSRFFYVRVAVLSVVLAVLVLYTVQDAAKRRARRAWARPLEVAIVLVVLEQPGPQIEPATLSAFRRRVRALESRLCDEYARYRPTSEHMFRLTPFGPVSDAQEPPMIESDSWWEMVRHTYRLWRYTSRIDAEGKVPARGFDSRIYVVMEAVNDESRKFVEGFSEQGGHIGVARVQLDESTADLSLFVVAHELLHTLGASDKYDATGRSQIPFGLGDPEQQPLYPQLTAEVMARNRVIDAKSEVVPETLDELRVGRWTAQEIGWTGGPGQ